MRNIPYPAPPSPKNVRNKTQSPLHSQSTSNAQTETVPPTCPRSQDNTQTAASKPSSHSPSTAPKASSQKVPPPQHSWPTSNYKSPYPTPVSPNCHTIPRVRLRI